MVGKGEGGRRERKDFFHQKIIKLFYGDDGFGARSLSQRQRSTMDSMDGVLLYLK